MIIDCWILILAFTAQLSGTWANHEVNITMPGARPAIDDAYLCHAMKLGSQPLYITSFEPVHFPETTHHMILFVCDQPGSNQAIWECGGESADGVCKDTESLVFSWAMDAPGLTLPIDTSYEVGTPGRRYMVLQVHYKDASVFDQSPSRRDYSGVRMQTLAHPTRRLVGIYLIATGGSIEPFGVSQLTAACEYTGRARLHPLAIRTHAHSHGLSNELYLGHNGELQLLGRKSPQEPQTFYRVNGTSQVVTAGDFLAARCIMYNQEGRRIYMGNTRTDEMCNVYFMYWVDRSDRYQLYDSDNRDCYSPSGMDVIPGLTAPMETELDYDVY